MIERLKPGIAQIVARIRTHPRVFGVAIGAVAVVAVIGASLAIASEGGVAQATPTSTPTATATLSPSPSASPSVVETPSFDPGPTALPIGWEYSDLDGAGAPANLAHRLPMAMMVDDNAVARPQSGISSASIVIQAAADGGEDRYEIIFQEGTATDIGPMRSARPYFVYWADEYKALFGHFGGDANSLQVVIPKNANYIYNMDDLNGGSCPYHRITTRAAPHNAYTNSAALIGCLTSKKYPTTYQNLPTRPFRDDVLPDQRPFTQSLVITYHTGTVGYEYNRPSDSYMRIIDGKPEVDPANNAQVYARTIVVMYQSVGFDPGSLDEVNRPYVYNVGTGKATIFMEGKAIDATWKKTSNTALTRFYDSSGAEIPFVRGEIFMQSVAPGTSVVVS